MNEKKYEGKIYEKFNKNLLLVTVYINLREEDLD